jgi:hypothetical protein
LPQIGVVIAQSANPDFRSDVRAGDFGLAVQSVGATRTGPVAERPASTQAIDEVPVTDPREAEQWDMAQIKADKAHEITDGSRRVLVGVNDSGVDDTHPDLAPNFDAANSVSCVNNGRPDTTEGAGGRTARTVRMWRARSRAARNKIGIFPEYSICGSIWAAEHQMDVTNHSYYIDPWVFWCNDDGDHGAPSRSRYAGPSSTPPARAFCPWRRPVARTTTSPTRRPTRAAPTTARPSPEPSPTAASTCRPSSPA